MRADGTKEILGLWLEQNKGAKFWLRVMNELRNRGVEDTLIAVVDGLKGFPDAIQAAFPDTTVQTCIVHLLRQSLDFVSYKDRKAVAAALSLDAAAGEAALTAFEEDVAYNMDRLIFHERDRADGCIPPESAVIDPGSPPIRTQSDALRARQGVQHQTSLKRAPVFAGIQVYGKILLIFRLSHFRTFMGFKTARTMVSTIVREAQ